MAHAQELLRKMLSDSISEKHYDIFFVVRSTRPDGTPVETRLGAHRVVLSVVSDKFEHKCTNVPNQPHSEIVVTECSAAAVREALELIYGGEMRQSQSSIVLALEIWHFGVLFNVHHLIQLARSSCLDNLSTNNCLRILDFAVRVADQQVVENLQNYTADPANFSHVIASPHFPNLSFDIVSTLPRPGKGECAWPEILTFEKVWFDALFRWLDARLHPDHADHRPPSPPPQKSPNSQKPQKPQQPSQQHVKLPDSLPDPVALPLIRKVLDLVDFTRMKTHELREVSVNEIALKCPSFSPGLVAVLLTRSEQLESTILERNIDLDVIGQKYQQALCDADEAERNARATAEKLDKLQASKQSLEKRLDDLRRKKSPTSTTPSARVSRRKVSGTSTLI